MSVIQERVVAAGRGILAERDLAEAASDFYVLELLTARGHPQGRKGWGSRSVLPANSPATSQTHKR
jgi:hypothetical protein